MRIQLCSLILFGVGDPGSKAREQSHQYNWAVIEISYGEDRLSMLLSLPLSLYFSLFFMY